MSTRVQSNKLSMCGKGSDWMFQLTASDFLYLVVTHSMD